jgi:hypothetical protein
MGVDPSAAKKVAGSPVNPSGSAKGVAGSAAPTATTPSAERATRCQAEFGHHLLGDDRVVPGRHLDRDAERRELLQALHDTDAISDTQCSARRLQIISEL